MIKSMTGFGRGVSSDGRIIMTAEIKAVNHRYCDITVKMPRRFAFAEEAVKGVVKSFTTRGKIDVMINVESSDVSDSDVKLDLGLAKKYYERLTELKDHIPELSGDISLRLISSLPDVMSLAPAEEDEDQILSQLTSAVTEACKNYDAMRTTEGSKLIADILMRNDLIERTALEIEEYAPKVAELYLARMRERMEELLGGGAQITEDRLLLEAAVFADKSNITEELVRLKSHVAQLRKIAASGEPAGKKLDFLVQEMNREANTIGSKANDINITEKMLLLKAEIEKIREQVQNIE
ncbi:MAG: YicC family protein [Firmicutes bacterium]|nr:YicC family protein [Bacillota bacterium]MBR0442098.1 YicC family protein [Bacillota bacterium]